MSKRKAILAAATRLFSRNGFKNTSMTDLTKATGAASGTIFHHFKNKETLFTKILEETRDKILDAFSAHRSVSVYPNGLKMIEGDIALYLHLAGTMEDRFLLLHRHFPYQMAETNSTCRTCLESIYSGLLDTFEEGIHTGIKDGSITKVTPRNTAMILFAMVDGVARLNTYNLYQAGSLYKDIVASCRSILCERQVS